MAQTRSASMRIDAARSTIFAVAAVVACSRGDALTGTAPPAPLVPVPPTVVSISVAPLTDTLRVGDGVAFNAVLRDTAGGILTDRNPTWTSTNPVVATVSASGWVSGVGPGSAMIVATSGTASAAGAVVVYAAKVFSVVLTPSVDTLFTTQQALLVPTLRDQLGRSIEVATNATWSSSDASVADVDASGRITGVSPGLSIITLTADGVSGTAAVLVRLDTPPASIDGDWTMTLSPSPSCRDKMPAIARERHYVVHFTQIGPDFQSGVRFGLTISSPTLEVANPNENGGNWDGTTIGFAFIGDTEYDGWSSTNLHDHLSATETLDFDGSVAGIISGSEIVATMSGDVEYWNGPRSLAGPTVGCRATDHVVSLRR